MRRTVVPEWVSADGPGTDVALSTRARLARNIEGRPFPRKAKESDLRRVADLVLAAIYSEGAEQRFGRLRVIQPARIREAAERLALVDTQVASRQHVDGGKYRPIVLNETGTLSLMVNEEDHLRIQCVLPGLQPMTALQMAQEFDVFLAGKIGYARTDNYGYLTSSLANIGTGLRLSVMLHVAGLSFLGEAVPALTAATALKISVRGLFGEGTRAFGDIYQVSNETTFGFSEKDIVTRVRAAVEHLINREHEARDKLAWEKKDELSVAVEEVRTAVMDARSLTDREAMACLSLLRLGSELRLGPSLSAKTFNELLISIGLGAKAGRASRAVISDAGRARLVRERLIEEFGAVQLTLSEEEPERHGERLSK